MSRYIDADKLLKGYEDHELISTHLIWNAPTADVVEVVRCKDCKYWNGELCKNHSNPLVGLIIGTDSNDYCSNGERKDGDEE